MRSPESVADMIAVLDEFGVERAHVVGHDWGAGLVWALAAFVPARVERLVVMSVGHPNTLREPSIEQREKAWYQLLFQFTGVAEALLQRDDWKLPFPAVTAPTLGLWSSGDNYLTEEPMLRTADHVTGPWRYERIEGAGHWLQLDAPERVNQLLLEFLS